MQEYSAMWKNYVNFKDRTSVRGYWMVVLFNGIILAVLYLLARAIPAIMILSTLYSLATLIPGLAITIRRLHDLNKVGWWILLALIPFVGAIILIVWFCFKSVEDGNRFGSVKV